MLCCGYTLTDFPISIRLTSLALWQSNDCPSASKATLMNMDKYFMWIHYERLHNHNKAKHNKTVCIFLGIYCNSPLIFGGSWRLQLLATPPFAWQLVQVNIKENTKQRVLMHGHQGWNVRHGLCHIYMIYVYIWVVYSFCLFCCLFIIVTTQFVALYKPCKPKPKPSTYDPPDNHPLAEIQRPILRPEPKQQICHQNTP